MSVCAKPFQTPHWQTIKFITPNFNELKQIASVLDVFIDPDVTDVMEQAGNIAKQLLKHLDNIIVTLGPKGIVIGRRGLATDPFLRDGHTSQVIFG